MELEITILNSWVTSSNFLEPSRKKRRNFQKRNFDREKGSISSFNMWRYRSRFKFYFYFHSGLIWSISWWKELSQTKLNRNQTQNWFKIILIFALLDLAGATTTNGLESNITAVNSALLLATINVSGLTSLNRRIDFAKWLNKMNPDICVVTETHFNSSQQQKSLFGGFNSFFSTVAISTSILPTSLSHNRAKHGVAILVKDHLQVEGERKGKGELDGRVIAITVAFPNEDGQLSKINIVGVYAPVGRIDKKEFYNELTQFILQLPGKSILAGDFNGHSHPSKDFWKSDSTKSADDCYFRDFLQNNNLVDAASWKGEPNIFDFYSYSNTSDSFLSRIDYILTTSINHVVESWVDRSLDLTTPHYPVMTIIDLKIMIGSFKNQAEELIQSGWEIDTKSFEFKQKFGKLVNKWIKNLDPKLLEIFSSTKSDIDSRVNLFDQMVKELNFLLVTETRKIATTRRKEKLDWESEEVKNIKWKIHRISKLIKAANCLNRFYIGTQFLSLSQEIAFLHLIETSKLIFSVPNLNDAHKIKQWTEFAKSQRKKLWKDVQLESIKHWKLVAEKRKKADKETERKFSRNWRRCFYKTSKEKLPSLVVTEDGSIAHDSEDIKEAMKDYYFQLGSPGRVSYSLNKQWLHASINKETIERIKREDVNQLTAEVNEEIFDFVLKKSKNRKAPGPDGIPYALIKLLPSEAKRIVRVLIDTMIRGKHFPDSISEGEIVSIFKKGSPLVLSNYRGITLLSVFYKLASATINARVNSILAKSNAWSRGQGGGKIGGQCLFKSATLLNIISDAKRKGKPLHVVSIDIQKAYDETPFEAFQDSVKYFGLGEDFLKLEMALEKSYLREFVPVLEFQDHSD